MKYLLDTGVLSAYLLGRSRIVSLLDPWIRQREACTSIIVYGEIDEYHRSKQDYIQRRQILLQLLAQVIPQDLNLAIMERYASIRRALRPPQGAGIIGDMDTLIAATALELQLTVVTADSDYSRVPALSVMSIERVWLKA